MIPFLRADGIAAVRWRTRKKLIAILPARLTLAGCARRAR
jgi:hypothetical protein